MATINSNFLRLDENYLFTDIQRRIDAYKLAHPEVSVISLGIGDVSRPLPAAVVEALHAAVEEMGCADTFRGYGPERGYEFLRQAIADGDFESRGIHLDIDEIFINDGAKSDTGNFGDILGLDCSLCMTDPIYPVYVDSNVMSGRAGVKNASLWSGITFCPCTEENNFIPVVPSNPKDLIYLCYPNNPTGTTLKASELERWVKYALENDALILFDAAYEAYITEPDVPHSIYEIEGARRCAVEFRSFSKTAGFTGLRCGYTVVPHEVTALSDAGERVPLGALWNRRQCTKFNGTPYIVQRAAAAIYTPEGRREVKETIDYYMGNARLMREALQESGLTVYGGVNAPYLWVKTPGGFGSWSFFDFLLEKLGLVCTPGVGFGPAGEGFVRLTAFGSRENCLEAMARLRTAKFAEKA